MTFDECAPGRFVDELSFDAKRYAKTIDATPPEKAQAPIQPLPDPTAATSADRLLHDLASVLIYVHRYGRLTSHEHDVVAAAIGKYHAWRNA